MAGADGIEVWDITQRKLLHKRSGSGKHHSLAWYPQGNVLAVGEVFGGLVPGAMVCVTKQLLD